MTHDTLQRIGGGGGIHDTVNDPNKSQLRGTGVETLQPCHNGFHRAKFDSCASNRTRE